MNVIVTGAASGIGCAIVTQLAAAGHRVIATDVNRLALERHVAEARWPAGSVTPAEHDVSDPAGWQRVMDLAAERFDTLDALVNVAGVLKVEPIASLRPESVALQIDVNAKGVILGTQAAAAVMCRQKRGRIVNIASMAALAPIPGIAVYSASKFAVRAFSLAAAEELAPLGVQVSVVCPDAVATPMVDLQLDHPTAAMTFSGPRILTADEVAAAVIELLTGKYRRELWLPWSRGLLARLSNLLPASWRRKLVERLTAKGMAKQRELKGIRTPQ